MSYAEETVIRPTRSCAANTRSEGMRDPTGSRPSRIKLRNPVATPLYAGPTPSQGCKSSASREDTMAPSLFTWLYLNESKFVRLIG